VKQPTQSIYININGEIVDWRSAYPHAIMEHNLTVPCLKSQCRNDWETCEHYLHKTKIYTLYGHYCTKEHGKIEKLIQSIFQKRQEYKAKGMDDEQYGCKIFLNAVYGAIAKPVFESVYNHNAAQDTTLIQRERHKYGMKRLEEEGYEVLYTDTDSYFIIDKYNNKEKLKKIQQNK